MNSVMNIISSFMFGLFVLVFFAGFFAVIFIMAVNGTELGDVIIDYITRRLKGRDNESDDND